MKVAIDLLMSSFKGVDHVQKDEEPQQGKGSLSPVPKPTRRGRREEGGREEQKGKREGGKGLTRWAACGSDLLGQIMTVCLSGRLRQELKSLIPDNSLKGLIVPSTYQAH